MNPKPKPTPQPIGENFPFFPTAIVALIVLVGSFPYNASAEPSVEKASWYSFKSARAEGTSGYYTASGEPFLENAMTCAMPHRNFDGMYKVTNTKNGKSVIVRHNDYGPGKKPRRKGVVIDLSRGAFLKIADLKQGVVAVTVERI